MDHNELARLFTEWMRRYQAEPEKFAADWLAGHPGDYGDKAASYLLQLRAEMASVS